MNEHTAGSWMVANAQGRIARVDNNQSIAAVYGSKETAQLIAAAPDLLAALRNAYDVLGMNKFERESCRRRIAAVLAKAGA